MLRYVRLRVVMEAVENVELPPFAGSTLRGAFMSALKKSACMTESACSEACEWPSACGYGLLCETPIPREAPGRLQASKFAPHPYVITPLEGGMRLAGELLRFELTLWGKAPRHLRTVIRSLEEMADSGVGRGRKKLRLMRVVDAASEAKLYADGEYALEDVSSHTVDLEVQAPYEPRILRVDLETPVKLKKRGKMLTELDFGELIYACADRLYILCHCHGASTYAPKRGDLARQARAADVKLIEDDTKRVSFKRYSRRQKRKHRLDGLVGHLVLAGNVQPFLPYLKAAEIFHLGKGTSFGLGALGVRVEVPPSVSKPSPSSSTSTNGTDTAVAETGEKS